MSEKPSREDLEKRIKELEDEVSRHKKTEETLRDLEARLHSLDELSPFGILTTDLPGVVTSCNEAFLRLTGYEQKDIKGKQFTMLPIWFKKDLNTYANLFKAIITSGFAETGEVKETQKLGAGQFIRKPLTLGRIGKAIKEELED